MKKQYTKPTMKVVKLNRGALLLTGSNPDYWGYTPAVGDDHNKLA